MRVKLANNKIIIYPGGATCVHLCIPLSQTPLWLHQSHQRHQHGELPFSETKGLRCKGLNSSHFTDDVWYHSHEIRSVRRAFAFWETLHTEIRNRKWSEGLGVRTALNSIALLKNLTYADFVLWHRQWFLADLQWLFTLCKLEDHLRKKRNQLPAGQSSPVQQVLGTWQLVSQVKTSLNQLMETLETKFQNITLVGKLDFPAGHCQQLYAHV